MYKAKSNYIKDSSPIESIISNDLIGYTDLILNGDPETYLKSVTEYKPLDLNLALCFITGRGLFCIVDND